LSSVQDRERLFLVVGDDDPEVRGKQVKAMGGECPRIGEDRVELPGPHGLDVRFEANYAVIGKDDDFARHLTEVATNEGGALILERKAKARRNSVRRDEGPVDADRVEERAYGLVLPPVSGRWAHTLRQQAMRRGVPFLAESAPQVGGVYLGPINHGASRELGMRAGKEHGGRSPTAELLLVALEALPNTRERVEGFLAGFTETFPGRLISHRVDGRGIFKEAMRQTREAFRTRTTIDVVFGVNDHTILGALEVARQLGAPVAGYSVGGEGGALFDELARGGLLKATLALFPEVVGRLAVDTICRRFAGEEVAEAVITPAEILAADTLADFYRREGDQWRIRPEVLDRMCEGRLYSGPSVAGRSIGFMLHYPSHDWYRNLAVAMRQRCADFGVRFTARNAEDEVAEQLRGIRRAIGGAAAAQVRARETLLVDGGECSRYFAEALKTAGREATVVTNSLAVLDELAGAPGVKVLLTAGEYQPATRSLVGPSVEQTRHFVGRGQNDWTGSPDVDSAAPRSLKLALVLKPRQVPPQRHRRDAPAAVDKRLQRNNASLLEQRQDCCLAFFGDHF
jgi:ABC-type sugar transport system substrate-binding protein